MRVMLVSEINDVFGGITEEAKQETREWVDSWSRTMGLLGVVPGAVLTGAGCLIVTNNASLGLAGIIAGAPLGYAVNYACTNVPLSHIYGV